MEVLLAVKILAIVVTTRAIETIRLAMATNHEKEITHAAETNLTTLGSLKGIIIDY